LQRRPAAGWGYIVAWLVLVAAGFAGAILLIAADFSTLRGVRAIEAVLQRVTAGDNHGFALTLIGIGALGFAGRALLRRGVAAMVALAAAGASALLVAVAVDVPSLGSPAPFDQYYAATTAWTGSAVGLELVGSALLFVSGCGQMVLYVRRPRAPQARPAPAAA
jgi:hypothetical protein